jgi:hypothetical protein
VAANAADELIHRLAYDPVRLVCDECGRRGQYRKETLIARHGPDIVGLIY